MNIITEEQYWLSDIFHFLFKKHKICTVVRWSMQNWSEMIQHQTEFILTFIKDPINIVVIIIIVIIVINATVCKIIITMIILIELVKLCESVWNCQKFQEKSCLATGSYALHTVLFLAIWELFVSIVTHICFILDRYFLLERKKRFSAIMKNHLVILWSHSSKKTLAPAFEKFCAVAELQKIKCKGGQMQAHPTQGAQRERGKGKTSSSVEL